MKKVAAFALIIFAVVGAAFALGTYYLLGTPMYSLYLVRTAVQEGDSETFFRHFDVSLVARNATKRMVEGLPAPVQAIAARVSGLTEPVIEAALRERIAEKLKDPDKSFVKDKSIDSIRYEDSTAYVSVKNVADDSTTVITLVRMPDRYWKIVDLDLGKHGIDVELPRVPSDLHLDPGRGSDSQTPALPRLRRRQ
jgi:hypothetical protein